MSAVTLRVKHAGGQGVVRGLQQTDSLEKLISHSLEALGIDDTPGATIRLLAGFPPKALDISDKDKSISESGIKTGDTIIFQVTPSQAGVEEDSERSEGNNKRQKTEKTESEAGPRPTSSLQRKIVPADNSCLFSAINYCMSGSLVPSEHSAFMREVIASVVSSDQEKYSEAYLGRQNQQYCTWILTKDAWGGAIEVQILAEYFQVEIVVVDTKSGSCTVFGESSDFPHQMVLIYDGIHYDALYDVAAGKEVTLHSAEDKSILTKALVTAKAAKAAHNYTDTTGFSLKCLVCGTKLRGETEAQTHAKTTAHTNFSEV